MKIQEAVDLIVDTIVELEETDEALTWEDECIIKKNIVINCELESIFSNEEILENIYTYEMFDTNQFKLTTSKQTEMISAWLTELDDYGINPDVSIEHIS